MTKLFYKIYYRCFIELSWVDSMFLQKRFELYVTYLMYLYFYSNTLATDRYVHVRI